MNTLAVPVATGDRYHTFWRRFGAAVVDSVVLFAVGALVAWGGMKATSPVVLTLLYFANGAVGLTYSIALHGRYGQTLGKMATHVKVVDLTENPIGFRQALLRDGPWLVLAAADTVWGTTSIANGVNPFLRPIEGWIPAIIVLGNLVWCIAEFATMVTNRRRRAIHDWIAGTVVVRL